MLNHSQFSSSAPGTLAIFLYVCLVHFSPLANSLHEVIYMCICIFAHLHLMWQNKPPDHWDSNIVHCLRWYIGVHQDAGVLTCFFTSSVKQNGFMKEQKLAVLAFSFLHWTCYLPLPLLSPLSTIWDISSIIARAPIQEWAAWYNIALIDLQSFLKKKLLR